MFIAQGLPKHFPAPLGAECSDNHMSLLAELKYSSVRRTDVAYHRTITNSTKQSDFVILAFSSIGL